jgi:FKBP-type peptidyl-prolyl cis-trans isomerase SlyD
MNTNTTPKVVENDVVVSLDYTLTVDGEIVDTSNGQEPIEFIQGYGQVVPGLEKALYGMALGEEKQLTVGPEEGYGVVDAEAFADIPRGEFPKEIPLEPAVELQLRNDDGEELDAYIESVDDELVRLNFNHPLAGKTLHFIVAVAGLRNATLEELDHGHIHHHDHPHD